MAGAGPWAELGSPLLMRECCGRITPVVLLVLVVKGVAFFSRALANEARMK